MPLGFIKVLINFWTANRKLLCVVKRPLYISEGKYLQEGVKEIVSNGTEKVWENVFKVPNLFVDVFVRL